jgi:tRNA (uracil-5-)-methyltransferase TRM9
MVPWVKRGSRKASNVTQKAEQTANGSDRQEQDRTFHRYYHLYASGELERDIDAAGGVVKDSGYEKDNWWAIATKQPARPPT